MLISQTPYRLSLFGGGSDTIESLAASGNKVLNVAMNKYSHCLVRVLPKFFESQHRLIYSKVEDLNTLEESEHPVIRNILKYMKIKNPGGLEIIHTGDLPSRSGVGSSSSFTVGLLNALTKLLKDKNLDNQNLAYSAIEIERDFLNEPGGIQDQVAAAFGGVCLFTYNFKNGIENLRPPYAQKISELIENNLYLGYTKTQRNSFEVINSIRKKESQDKYLKDLVKESQKLNQKIINSLPTAKDFYTTVTEGLKVTSELKQKILEITDNSFPKELVDNLRKSPFDCFKFMGGGGGGFFFVISKEKYSKKDLMNFLPSVSIWNQIEVSKFGSRIIKYE